MKIFEALQISRIHNIQSSYNLYGRRREAWINFATNPSAEVLEGCKKYHGSMEEWKITHGLMKEIPVVN